MPDLVNVTAAHFVSLLHERFVIHPDDARPFEVELTEVTEIAREPGGRAPLS